jgi:transcriptional regulator with XRE-family HTH domain
MTGKELKEFRLKHGLNQSELAELVGVKANTVSKWESGIRNIGQSAIKLLETYSLNGDKPIDISEEKVKDDRFEDIVAGKVLEKFQPIIKEILQSHEGTKKEVAKLILDVDDLQEEIEELKELIQKMHQTVDRL